MAFVGFGGFNRANQAALLQLQQQSLLGAVNQFAPAPVGGVFGGPQNLQAMAYLMQALQSVFAAFSSFAGGQMPNAGTFGPGGIPGSNGNSFGPGGIPGNTFGPGGIPGNNSSSGYGGQGGYGGSTGAPGGQTSYPMPGDYGGQSTAPTPSPAPMTEAERTRSQSAAAGLLSSNFDRIDRNRDGVITADEINLFRDSQANAPQATRDALGSLADAVPELMFGTIQSGETAWFGLSRQDLTTAHNQLNSGTSLQDIQRATQMRVIRERNIPFNGRHQSPAEAFRTYVEQQRTRVLRSNSRIFP